MTAAHCSGKHSKNTLGCAAHSPSESAQLLLSQLLYGKDYQMKLLHLVDFTTIKQKVTDFNLLNWLQLLYIPYYQFHCNLMYIARGKPSIIDAFPKVSMDEIWLIDIDQQISVFMNTTCG